MLFGPSFGSGASVGPGRVFINQRLPVALEGRTNADNRQPLWVLRWSGDEQGNFICAGKEKAPSGGPSFHTRFTRFINQTQRCWYVIPFNQHYQHIHIHTQNGNKKGRKKSYKKNNVEKITIYHLMKRKKSRLNVLYSGKSSILIVSGFKVHFLHDKQQRWHVFFGKNVIFCVALSGKHWTNRPIQTQGQPGWNIGKQHTRTQDGIIKRNGIPSKGFHQFPAGVKR